MSEKLESCPFCGGPARIVERTKCANMDGPWLTLFVDHAARCIIGLDQEAATLPATEENRQRLVKAWNRRAPAANVSPDPIPSFDTWWTMKAVEYKGQPFVSRREAAQEAWNAIVSQNAALHAFAALQIAEEALKEIKTIHGSMAACIAEEAQTKIASLRRLSAAAAKNDPEKLCEVAMPADDKIYAEVCRQRDEISNQRHVSMDAVSDVMRAVRSLCAEPPPSAAGEATATSATEAAQ